MRASLAALALLGALVAPPMSPTMLSERLSLVQVASTIAASQFKLRVIFEQQTVDPADCDLRRANLGPWGWRHATACGLREVTPL